MSITKAYVSKFRKNFPGFFPNFPARDNISVGDFGIVDKGCFAKIGNIKTDLGIDFETREMPLSGHEEMESSCETSFSSKDDAKFEGIIRASIKLDMKKANSVYFSTVLSSLIEVENIFGNIRPQILALYKAGKWEKKYVMISTIEKTKNTVIVVTEESGSEVVLCSDFNAPVEKLLTVDANVNFGVARNTNGAYVFTQGEESSISHRFKLIKIKGLFKKKIEPLMATEGKADLVEELR